MGMMLLYNKLKVGVHLIILAAILMTFVLSFVIFISFLRGREGLQKRRLCHF